MEIRLSPFVLKELTKIKLRNPKLANKIEKQFILFTNNPTHPSLRIHKLSGELNQLWSLAINKSFRMVYILKGETAYFTNLGTHDQVYGKK